MERPARPDPAASTGAGSAPLHDLIVLAGGGGTRLGGVDKSALQVGGRSLLGRVLDAAALARHVVVVGQVVVPGHVRQTVEDPPGGGPVAGIAAGIGALAREAAPWTLVIAVDQPEAAEATADLLLAAAAAPPEVDLVCPVDETGHPQWLLAAYRTASLQRALSPHGTGHNVSVHRLVSDLTMSEAITEHVGDIDTWADHADWDERLTE